MGEEGALFTQCDNSYLLAEPDKTAKVLKQAPVIFGRMGLRIGFNLGKTELMSPKSYDMSNFPNQLDNLGIAAPHVVQGFSSILTTLPAGTNTKKPIPLARGEPSRHTTANLGPPREPPAWK